eukprot:6464154-Amphidinium_carterae.1
MEIADKMSCQLMARIRGRVATKGKCKATSQCKPCKPFYSRRNPNPPPFLTNDFLDPWGFPFFVLRFVPNQEGLESRKCCHYWFSAFCYTPVLWFSCRQDSLVLVYKYSGSVNNSQSLVAVGGWAILNKLLDSVESAACERTSWSSAKALATSLLINIRVSRRDTTPDLTSEKISAWSEVTVHPRVEWTCNKRSHSLLKHQGMEGREEDDKQSQTKSSL